MYSRLMYYDGASYRFGEQTVPAVGNYRLVFETDLKAAVRTPPMAVSYYKVFEVIRGARITGKAKPHSSISLELPLMANTGRTMYYTNATRSDKRGTYEFRVPYSTETMQGAVKPRGRYNISGSGIGTLTVRVTETEVVEGLDVDLSYRRTAKDTAPQTIPPTLAAGSRSMGTAGNDTNDAR